MPTLTADEQGLLDIGVSVCVHIGPAAKAHLAKVEPYPAPYCGVTGGGQRQFILESYAPGTRVPVCAKCWNMRPEVSDEAL